MFESDSVRGAFTAFLDAYGGSGVRRTTLEPRTTTDRDVETSLDATRRDADPPVQIPAGVGVDPLYGSSSILGLPVSASSLACFS